MKKIITTVLCVFLCAAAFTACGKEEIKKKNILEGDSVIGAEIYKNEKLVGAEYYGDGGVVNRKLEYDKNGNTSLEENLVDGKVKNSTTYKYTADGDLTESEQTVFASDGSKRAVTESGYFDGKVITQTITNYSNGEESSFAEREYRYNDDGSELKIESLNDEPASETLTDSSGEVLSVKKYSEDNSAVKYIYQTGVLLKTEDYDNDGSLVSYTEYTYGNDGKTSRTDKFDAEENLISYSVYRYSDGKLYRIFIYDADGTMDRYAAYDENGNCTICDPVGNPIG